MLSVRPLADPAIPKIGHNLKYDCLILRNVGIQVAPLSFDTMIAAWVVEPDSHRLGLKAMAESELHISMTHIDELIGKRQQTDHYGHGRRLKMWRLMPAPTRKFRCV